MIIEIISGNIGTGKTAYALSKQKQNPNIMYLDVEALGRSLSPDSSYCPAATATKQGLIKDFLRRTLPSSDVILETTSVGKSSRKSLATMVKRVADEKGISPASYSIVLVNFGSGNEKSLEKAVSHPVVVAGGDSMKSKIIDRFLDLQRNYDNPSLEEGFHIIQ